MHVCGRQGGEGKGAHRLTTTDRPCPSLPCTHRAWLTPSNGLTIKGSATTQGSDGLFGAYTSVNTTWSVGTKGATLTTSTTYFAAQGVVVFTHELPGGGKNTNASNPTLPATPGLDQGAYPPVIAFPAFDAVTNTTALSEVRDCACPRTVQPQCTGTGCASPCLVLVSCR